MLHVICRFVRFVSVVINNCLIELQKILLLLSIILMKCHIKTFKNFLIQNLLLFNLMMVTGLCWGNVLHHYYKASSLHCFFCRHMCYLYYITHLFVQNYRVLCNWRNNFVDITLSTTDMRCRPKAGIPRDCLSNIKMCGGTCV